MSNFLVLIALNAKNASIGKAALAGLRRDIDPQAAPHWIDSNGVGIFVSTTLSSKEVWAAAFPQQQTDALKDMLVLQLGEDSRGYPETKASAWLGSHRPAR